MNCVSTRSIHPVVVYPMDFSIVISAFFAGLFTFLAPCTLPLVPGYLSFISGVSAEELGDEKKFRSARRKIFICGLMYVIGFSTVFIFFTNVAIWVSGFLKQSATKLICSGIM